MAPGVSRLELPGHAAMVFLCAALPGAIIERLGHAGGDIRARRSSSGSCRGDEGRHDLLAAGLEDASMAELLMQDADVGSGGAMVWRVAVDNPPDHP